jgi:dolichol-phosphate mannosyltransferase
VYRGLKIAAVVPVLNEEKKIGAVVSRTPRPLVDDLVVIDDGSSDDSAAVAESLGARLISMGRVVGVGAALRAGFAAALAEGCDVVVVMAGNNKDAPEEIPLLLDPIVDGRADFVQGSRFLPQPGSSGERANFGEMPFYRRVATRVHPILFSLVARRWVSESTNGFRAIRRSILEDERIDLDQSWLREYELEPYLYLRVLRLGYPTAEVPVTKVYPPKHLGQSKMTPIIGWWSILRPLVFLGLGLKK